jgi:hypothetical protein
MNVYKDEDVDLNLPVGTYLGLGMRIAARTEVGLGRSPDGGYCDEQEPQPEEHARQLSDDAKRIAEAKRLDEIHCKKN